MPLPRTDFEGLDGGGDSDRLPSPNIWWDCPWTEIHHQSRPGVCFYDDFLSFPVTPPTTEGNFGQYAVFSSTGGTITAGTGQGGEMVIASDGDNEGVGIRTVATPFTISRASKQLWFEARLKTSTATDTKHGFVFGLADNVASTATSPIAADGTLADRNFLFFHRLEGDGDKLDTAYRSDGVAQVNIQTDAVTVAADTFIKLGFRYDPSDDPLGAYYLTGFANNALLSTGKEVDAGSGVDFPTDVGLGLVLAILNATGSTPGSVTIDWWRAAQLI